MGTTQRVLSGSKTKGSTATLTGTIEYFYQGINAKDNETYFGSLLPRMQSGPRMALFRGTQRVSDKYFDDTIRLPDTFSAIMSSSVQSDGTLKWHTTTTCSVDFLSTNPVHLQLQFERPPVNFGQPPSVPHEGPYIAVTRFNAVSFIEADERTMWPVNLTNVGSILGREFDGVIEPLDIRSEILGIWNTKHLGHSTRGALVGSAGHNIFGSKEIKDRWNKYDPGPAPFLDAPMLFAVTASLKTSTRTKEFDFGKLTATLTKLGDIHLATQGFTNTNLSRDNPWQEKNTEAVVREPLFVHNPPVVVSLNDGVVGYDLTPSSSRSQKVGGFFTKGYGLDVGPLAGTQPAPSAGRVGEYGTTGRRKGEHNHVIAWWRMQQLVGLLTGSFRIGAGTTESPYTSARRLFGNDASIGGGSSMIPASLTISGAMILSDSSGNGITASAGDVNRYYGGIQTVLTGNLWNPMSASRTGCNTTNYFGTLLPNNNRYWAWPDAPSGFSGLGYTTPSGSLIFGARDDRDVTSIGGGGFEITDRDGKFSFAGMVSGSSAAASRRDRPFSISFWIMQATNASGSAAVTGGTGKGWFGGNTDTTVIAKEDAGTQESGGGWNSNRRQWRVTLPNQGENIRLTLYTDDSNYVELNPPGAEADAPMSGRPLFGYFSKDPNRAFMPEKPKWAHVVITFDPPSTPPTAVGVKVATAFFINGVPRAGIGDMLANEVGTYSGMSGSLAQSGPPYPVATGKPVPGSAAAKPLLIAPDLNQGFRTQLADLAVWNVVLGRADVKALYFAGVSRQNYSINSNSGFGVSKIPPIMEALGKMDYPDDGNLNVRDVDASHGFYFSKKAGSIVYGDE